MAIPPTPNFGIPLYDRNDPATLDTLLNGQARALDAALTANIMNFRGTNDERLALAAPRKATGTTWYTTDTGIEWFSPDSTTGTWTPMRKVPLVRGGFHNAGTDGNGYLTISHGLGVTPAGVSANIASNSPVIPDRLKVNVEPPNATTFRVKILRSDQNDAPMTGNPVHVFWTAVAP